ncbi:MAG: tRNA dihydrouridine synthase DusB [Elusimicrobiota bacterium]|jgi:nifR3 family TIM-barrel protein|nr:tRNA dihydrouridine synthase DusB [Elusimicrobiota bacterium]
METLIKPLKIGSFICPSNLILAPMAGITDSPFRLLCLRGGAGLVCAEMVSANALKFSSKKSFKMLSINPKEHPLSMQVFGGDPQTIALAARLAEKEGADIIDINAGCPAKKVNKSGAGCVLMKDPAKIGEIVAAARKSVKIPITLKTRISLNKAEILSPLIAKIAQDNGADAITIHARAAVDMHSGEPNLKALEETCKAVNIPVIGNGGITDAKSAKAMFNCGCQGIMIGRGAVGNPFIFSEIAATLNGLEPKPLSLSEKIKIFKELIEENVKFYGESTGVSRSKKTVGYWLKDFEGSSAVRSQLVLAQTLSEVEKILAPLIK